MTRADRFRVALVNPFDRSDPELPLSPLALGYIASHLENHGIPCDLFNFERDDSGAEAQVARHGLGSYDLIGFASYTHTFPATVRLVEAVRAANSRAHLVLGGYHATELPTEVLRDVSAVDGVIRQEGEAPFLALALALRDGRSLSEVPNYVMRDPRGKVSYAPCLPLEMNLDAQAFPKRRYANGADALPEFLDVRSGRLRRVFHVVSSRGCPYKCNYCSIPVSVGRKMRYRSTESVLSEVRQAHTHQDFEHIFFSEPNFLVSHKRARELAVALHEEWPDLSFSFETRADQIVRFRETIEILGRNGCSVINIGIESGSDAVLKRLNKGTSVAQNEEAIAILRQCGIHPSPYMIMFDRDCTIADLRASIDLLKRTGSYTTLPHYSTLYGRLEPLPGVAYRTYYEEKWGLADVHALSPALFEDGDVAAFYAVLKTFRHRYDAAINEALSFADKLRSEMNPKVRAGRLRDDSPRGAARAYQVALLDAVSLVHLPYVFFEGLVGLFEAAPGSRPALDDLYPDLRLAELDRILARFRAARAVASGPPAARRISTTRQAEVSHAQEFQEVRSGQQKDNRHARADGRTERRPFSGTGRLLGCGDSRHGHSRQHPRTCLDQEYEPRGGCPDFNSSTHQRKGL